MIFQSQTKCRWHPTRGFELDGKPVYIVGTNYVARHVCTNFWDDWRPEVMVKDLERIAATGLNAVRIPIHWEYAEPSPGQFRPEMLERLTSFMAMARQQGLFVMPWFLVGVATQDYDVSWRGQRSFFDEFMTVAAENHLKMMVNHLACHPNTLCWDICDEPEWYRRHPGAEQLPYHTVRFHAWVDRMVQAIKSVDQDRAVTLGFGHIATGNYGMDIRRAARQLDVMVVTAYPPFVNDDLLHGFCSTYFLGWSIRINDCMRKGVFTCESPGYPDTDASEDSIGKFYEVCLMSNFVNGSQGVMPWVWNDFDDSIQHLKPLDKHPQEKRFGITRDDGTLKPAGERLRKFAAFVQEFPPAEWRAVTPEVGVIVPVQVPENLHQEFAALFYHYALLRQAHLRVQYLWPEDLGNFRGQVLFLPSSSALPLTTPQWLTLQDWVRKGGALVSTGPHFSSVFNELFGLIVEGKQKFVSEISFLKTERPFVECNGLAFKTGETFTSITPAGATVLCSGSDGLPLVTRQVCGRGQGIFIACAPELSVSGLHPEELARHRAHHIFRAVASLAGLSCSASCPAPQVEFEVRQHADGRRLAILINHSRQPVTTQVQDHENGRITPVHLPGSAVSWIMLPSRTDGGRSNG